MYSKILQVFRRILPLLFLVMIAAVVIVSRLAGVHSMTTVKTFLENLSAILWSMAQIVLVLLLFALSWILFRWMSKRSGTVILAFENATGLEKYDGRAISDSLVAELHRIRQIHERKYEGIQSETLSPIVLVPNAESLDGDLREVGTVGVGETKISVGSLLMSLKRLFPFGDPGSVITGSVQKYGLMVRLVARMEHHEITAWEVTRKLDHDEQLPDLVRDLAYQVARDLSPNISARTAAGFKHFSEALEGYHSFKQTGLDLELERARFHSLAASKAEQGYKTLFRLIYNLGVAYFDKSDYAKSEELFRTANELTPDKDALNSQGASLSRMGRIEEADRAYQQSILLDSTYALSYSNLAGNLIGSPGREQDAMNAAMKAVELDPKLSHAHSVLGGLYTDKEDYEKAEAAYQESLKLDPSFVNSHSGLGDLYFNQSRYADAISEFNRTIELAPSLSNANSGLGNAYVMLGNYEKAVKFYERAIKLSGSNGAELTLPHNGLGLVFYHQKKFEEAAEEFKTAIKFDPTSAAPRENLGQVHLHRNQIDKAKTEFEAARNLSPRSHSIYLHLGYVLALKNDHAGARKLWQQASNICLGKSPSDIMYHALYKVALGDSAGGVAEMQTILKERQPPLGLLRGLLDEAELLAKSPAPPANAEQLYGLLQEEDNRLKSPAPDAGIKTQ